MLMVAIAQTEELSALGAAYMAGIGAGFYEKEKLFVTDNRKFYYPTMQQKERNKILECWKEAIEIVMR